MHQTVYEFARRVVEEYGLNESGNNVVEIGSWNTILDNCGSNSIRDFFDKVNYVGYDTHEGPGVDKVIVSVTDILNDYQDIKADVIVCTEVLEHDITFWVTMNLIGSLLKKDGYLILSARGVDIATNIAMGEHSLESGDYWRFMPQAHRVLITMANCSMVELYDDTQYPGFYALGKGLGS